MSVRFADGQDAWLVGEHVVEGCGRVRKRLAVELAAVAKSGWGGRGRAGRCSWRPGQRARGGDGPGRALGSGDLSRRRDAAGQEQEPAPKSAHELIDTTPNSAWLWASRPRKQLQVRAGEPTVGATPLDQAATLAALFDVDGAAFGHARRVGAALGRQRSPFRPKAAPRSRPRRPAVS